MVNNFDNLYFFWIFYFFYESDTNCHFTIILEWIWTPSLKIMSLLSSIVSPEIMNVLTTIWIGVWQSLGPYDFSVVFYK